MANSVSGSFSCTTRFTTTFDASGTAGAASEVNNLQTGDVSIGPAELAGRQCAEQWSKSYANLAAPVTIDLTALTGIGGRAVVLPRLAYLKVINADPTAGHDIQVGPGASNGLATPFPGTGGLLECPGGLPGAGVVGNNVVGNVSLKTNFSAAGYVVDATHKTITITPVGTVTLVKIIVAG